jgi:hypothetical protein
MENYVTAAFCFGFATLYKMLADRHDRISGQRKPDEFSSLYRTMAYTHATLGIIHLIFVVMQ